MLYITDKRKVIMIKQRLVSSWVVVIFFLLPPAHWANAEGNGSMILEQVDDSVSGVSIMEGYPCSIEGKVQNRRLNFKYRLFHFNSRELKASGEGWFELDSGSNQFAGSWRKDGESTWRVWTGTRNPAPTSPIFGFDVRFTSGKSALAIPFKLDNDQIRLLASVNTSPPLSFILDTGSSSNYPKLGLRNAESLGLKLQPLGMKNGGVGAELPDVYLVKDTTSFSLPGVVLSSQWLLVISLDKVNQCMDQATNGGIGRNVSSDQRAKEGTSRYLDGIIGKGFFSSFVVEIDYAARLINLYDPLNYKYTGKGKSFPLEIEPQSELFFVRVQVKALGRPPVEARLIVDTGSSTALTLNKQFAEAHKLLPPTEQLTATDECGIGGVAEGTSYEGTLEALQLGDFKLSNPVTIFRHKLVGEGYDGLLGGAALRNFKVIFDYSRSRMILESSSQVKGER
jgi:aspartyl protease